MFSINDKFLDPDADIRLNKALMGKNFAPAEPLLALSLTFKKNAFREELRQLLLDALEPFTILEFEFSRTPGEDIRLFVELATTHQPNTILSVIELVFEKNKKAAI